VASVKDKDAKVHFLKDPNRGTIYDGPLIVLVNGASASASDLQVG
jgi:carboxyl-terminal processing protease